MTPLVKICGVTVAADVRAAVAAGADFLGLNLWPGSRRAVTVEQAVALAAAARGAPAPSAPPQIVGVFVDAAPDAIARATEAIGLDVIQLHGDERPEACGDLATRTGARVWKAIAVGGPDALAELGRFAVDAVLLDAPSPGRGGGGVPIDWGLARRAVDADPTRRIILAGGLTAETVAAAIEAVRPWAVDVASGVEAAPGIKDHAKLRAFVAAARG